MSVSVIKVENLAKQYRIGEGDGYKTFREAIVNLCRAPLRRLNGDKQQSEIRRPESETIWALKDVSFKVQQGEVIGIIGRNGAGKSTLLKILSKITEPTEGRIELRGRVGSLLEVGTGFHPELTGLENIYLYGAILGMDRWEVTRKFDEIVAFANLEKFINTPVKRYSSGMYMRLAFAVAAHLETEILLIDEVLAVGDMSFQKKCLGKMGQVANAGRTVLFVSHNMATIRKLCGKCLLIDAGKIIHSGSTGACISKYLSRGNDNSAAIKDHIKYHSNIFDIDSVTVNDSPSDHLKLPAESDSLNIEISGQISQSVQFDVEARIYDLYDTPLAFFSPGHETGKIETYQAGTFTINRSIQLPKIVRGEYLMSLYLTTPNINCWVEFPHAVKLTTEGTPTSTGQVFDYYLQRTGWIFLSEASTSE